MNFNKPKIELVWEKIRSYLDIKSGFTLVEILIVLSIIAILSSVVLVSVLKAKEASYYVAAKEEFNSIRNSIEMYVEKNGDYPPDTDRSVPPGLESYLSSGTWPESPWPGSSFDWDNWTDPDTGESIYQISIRFCPLGDPSRCRFPKQSWASDFDYFSSVYYCISGPCRSHISKPIDHPGRCVNCD
jgi:prepilin-type N-terminal cleavage/methylation domain-containing protein